MARGVGYGKLGRAGIIYGFVDFSCLRERDEGIWACSLLLRYLEVKHEHQCMQFFDHSNIALDFLGSSRFACKPTLARLINLPMYSWLPLSYIEFAFQSLIFSSPYYSTRPASTYVSTVSGSSFRAGRLLPRRHSSSASLYRSLRRKYARTGEFCSVILGPKSLRRGAWDSCDESGLSAAELSAEGSCEFFVQKRKTGTG